MDRHIVKTQRVANTKSGGIMLAVIGSLGLLPFFLGAPLFFVLLFGTVSVLLILAGLAVVAGAMIEDSKWHPLEVEFEQHPVPLGSTSVVRLQRRSKKTVSDIAKLQVDVNLVCTEHVTFRKEADTKERADTSQTVTIKREVFNEPLTITASLESNTFTALADLTIPVSHGSPTFDLRHNKVSWHLEIAAASLPKMKADLVAEFTVAGSLDRQHQRFVDGPPPPRPLGF